MESTSSICSIFVYGTLKRGQHRENHWPRKPTVVRPAFILARLYDLGPYPAVTEGGEPVRGELWQFPKSHMRPTLDVLDVIEGYVPGRGNNLYERVAVPVHSAPACMDENPIVAFLYQMNAEKLPITARLIRPRKHRMVVGLTGSDPTFAHWPIDNAPPNVTSGRPDPYPDDVAG